MCFYDQENKKLSQAEKKSFKDLACMSNFHKTVTEHYKQEGERAGIAYKVMNFDEFQAWASSNWMGNAHISKLQKVSSGFIIGTTLGYDGFDGKATERKSSTMCTTKELEAMSMLGVYCTAIKPPLEKPCLPHATLQSRILSIFLA